MNIIPVEKNKEYEIDILNLGYEGEGVGKINDFAIFVEGALPYERVIAKIVKVNKSYAFGKLIKIIKASPYRIEPMCNLKRCGGCQLMHLSYDKQLEFKTQRVIDSLKRIGKIENVAVNNTIGMENPLRYRNKAMFPMGIKDKDAVIGFYAPRSHEVIDTISCLIQNEASDKIIAIIKEWIKKYNVSIYDEETQKGLLRHVMVRKAYKTGDTMAVIVINGKDIPYKNELIEDLTQNIIGIKSIVLNINKEKTNVALGNANKTIWGQDYITDYIGDLKFNISPLSFFQVNPVQTEILYNKALEYANLSGIETVIDAYCGTGTISLFLARNAKKVYGVEIVEPAIIDAKKNAKQNNIENVEFICGKSEEIIPNLYKKGIKADVIVVDPPRKGCDLELLKTIVQMKPERIVYVSCDVGTLARDLNYLEENGFKVSAVQPVDMFPWTGHVETVVLITKCGSDTRK